MAVLINKKPCLIIDRTLTELSKIKKQFTEEEVLIFCRLLKKIGVDLIEINGKIMKKIAVLAPDIEFIMQLESEDDLELYSLQESVKFCVLTVGENLLKEFKQKKNKFKDCKIILECKGNTIDQFEELIEDKYFKFNNINYLRIQGLSRYMAAHWQTLIQKITKKSDIGIDICPENEYCLATSIALDLPGTITGISFISASFNGIGGYAPLEELLMAAKVIKGYEISADFSLLQSLKRKFEDLVGETIANDKPVIGKNIFKYESGIHADGIEKNSMTYEPYQPEMVGLERKLVIGKHSGKKAVICKLKELKITYDEKDIPEILNKIKKMSIILKREISDHELANLCH